MNEKNEIFVWFNNLKSWSDFGKYQYKSNGILLQLPDIKSIFPVTITFTEIVTEFLSNYFLNKVFVSKYFTYSKIVIDYLSKYYL